MKRTEIKKENVNYDEKRIKDNVVSFVKRNPVTISILLALIAFGCVWAIFLTPSYAEVSANMEPVPTMTIGGFVGWVFEAELPVFWWGAIFLFLWLTKWN